MAGNETLDPTTEAILTVLREEAVNSPNMDTDTLAGRIAYALPASEAARSAESDALNRANERIAELTAQCAEHVDTIDKLNTEHESAMAKALEDAGHDTGTGGDAEQTGAGATDKADGTAPATGGVTPS